MSQTVEFPSSYEPVERLGAGSFGEVWKARRPGEQREYAVKLLGTPRGEESLLDDLELTQGLRHPHLAVPVDWGILESGRVFVVSDFVPGVTLRTMLENEGKLTVGEACRLLGQVLDALSCAHATGIVHRDVKPENIMVSGVGAARQAVLIDFGLGGYHDHRRAGHEVGAFSGTLRYAAPEQIRGGEVGPGADLFSWGMVLLECLVGANSRSDESSRSRLVDRDSSGRSRIPAAIVDRGLRWALARVTAVPCNERAVSCDELFRVLEDPSWLPEKARGFERQLLTVLACRRRGSNDGGLPPRVVATLIRESSSARGGIHIDNPDDLEVVAFGLDGAREDDAVRAARTACELLDAGVIDGAAIDVGAVELEVGGRLEEQVERAMRSGVAVAATRLTGAAGVGQLLVSTAASALLADHFEIESHCGVDGAVAVRAAAGGFPELRIADETPFVGRVAEIEAIERLWSPPSGKPRVALLIGEPGIGKSRLVREICGRCSLAKLLIARCSPEIQATQLAPIAAMLSAHGAKVFDWLDHCDLDAAQVAPALARVLGLDLPEGMAPLRQTPEREKLIVLDALVALLRLLAEDQSLIVVVEDLHWVDTQTQEFLEKLTGSGELSGRLLLLLTARSPYGSGWIGARGAVFPIAPLGDEEVAQLLGEGLSAELRARIIEQAEGVPLFAAEVARMVAAGQLHTGAGATVPIGLRALIADRLNDLSETSRAAVHTAAALGRQFDAEVLYAATRSDGVGAADLSALIRAGILTESAGTTNSLEFRHALIRDAVYDSIPDGQRTAIHQEIAGCLRGEFPEVAVKRPEILARQLESAGESVDAAEYWKRAGEAGLRQAAYQEAEKSAVRGLSLIEELEIDERTGSVQIELLTVLATGQFMVGGYAHPDVAETLSRAMVVADQLGDNTPLPVLNGLWTYHLSRSHRAETQQMIPIFERIAESEDPVIALEGNAVVGVDAWYAGEFRKAAVFLERAVELYHRREFREYADNYGYNGGIYSYPYAMMAHFFLGNMTDARRLRSGMEKAALEAGDPYSRSISNVFSALFVLECGEAETALRLADLQIALSLEQQLSLYMAAATCCKGIAERMLGNAEQGLMTLQYGMAMYQGMGIDSAYANYLTNLATTLLELGRHEEAESAILEGIEHCATCHCRYHEPEFDRLRGELALARGDDQVAEEALLLSLDKARGQENIPFQLRTGAVLVRFWLQRGRRDAALGLLDELSGDTFDVGTLDWRRLIRLRLDAS